MWIATWNTGNFSGHDRELEEELETGRFSFLFAQLASFNPGGVEPAISAWAGLREAQSMTLRLPNTGMAVTTDG